MGNPVVHFEVSSKDPKQLKAFYSGVFDWKMNDWGDKYTYIDAGDGPSGGIGPSPDGYPGHLTFYVLVADPEKTLEEVVARGGKVIQPVMQVPDGPTIALFADPEGNTVGLRKA